MMKRLLCISLLCMNGMHIKPLNETPLEETQVNTIHETIDVEEDQNIDLDLQANQDTQEDNDQTALEQEETNDNKDESESIQEDQNESDEKENDEQDQPIDESIDQEHKEDSNKQVDQVETEDDEVNKEHVEKEDNEEVNDDQVEEIIEDEKIEQTEKDEAESDEEETDKDEEEEEIDETEVEKEEVELKTKPCLKQMMTTSNGYMPLVVHFIQDEIDPRLKKTTYVEVVVNQEESRMIEVCDGCLNVNDLLLKPNDFIQFKDDLGQVYSLVVNQRMRSNDVRVNLYLDDSGCFKLRDGKARYVTPYPEKETQNDLYRAYISRDNDAAIDVYDSYGNQVADCMRFDPNQALGDNANLEFSDFKSDTKLFTQEKYQLNHHGDIHLSRFQKFRYARAIKAVVLEEPNDDGNEKTYLVGLIPKLNLDITLLDEYDQPVPNVTLEFYEDVERTIPLKYLKDDQWSFVTDHNGMIKLEGAYTGCPKIVEELKGEPYIIEEYSIDKEIYIKARNLPANKSLCADSNSIYLKSLKYDKVIKNKKISERSKDKINFPCREKHELKIEEKLLPDTPITGDDTNIVPYLVCLLAMVFVITKTVYLLKNK